MVGTDVTASPRDSDAPAPTRDVPDAVALDAPRGFTLFGVPAVVLLVGLVVTATLALTARSVHSSNEDRLLHQRVDAAAAVITAAIPNTQAELSAAAVLVETTNANRRAFSRFFAPLAGGEPFVSASVWRADTARPILTVGRAPEMSARPSTEILTMLRRATRSTSVSVFNLLNAPARRLGYGASIGPGARYVVYAETSLPQDRRAKVAGNSAFADLDYAIYLGSTADPAALLASSVANPVLRGPTSSGTVPFGDSRLHIVMSARRELGGDLLANLPWLIAGFGLAIALAAALLTDRLVRRRAYAEHLAVQNARLFSEQRSVAQTLQHALLPDTLPTFAGLELAVRYVPGVDGVDIGGDWYDVIGVGDGQVMIVVGDVSGRGLRAATVMAALRSAIRAYVAQGDAPDDVLVKLSQLISVGDGHFATVLCGLVDVAERRVTFANAGHPNPLLIEGSAARFIPTKVGVPVGVAAGAYTTVTITVPVGGVLVGFTDGLFERRGEGPDAGLERLREASTGYATLDDLLDGLLHVLTPDGGHDDTAILAVTWNP